MEPSAQHTLEALRQRYAEMRCPKNAKSKLPLPPLWRFGAKHGTRQLFSTRLLPTHLAMLYECSFYLEINLTDTLCEALSHFARGKAEAKTRESWLHECLDLVELDCLPVAVVALNRQVEIEEE